MLSLETSAPVLICSRDCIIVMLTEQKPFDVINNYLDCFFFEPVKGQKSKPFLYFFLGRSGKRLLAEATKMACLQFKDYCNELSVLEELWTGKCSSSIQMINKMNELQSQKSWVIDTRFLLIDQNKLIFKLMNEMRTSQYKIHEYFQCSNDVLWSVKADPPFAKFKQQELQGKKVQNGLPIKK